MNRTNKQRLEDARILIYGVNENASIKERIEPIYTAEKIATGIALYQATYEADKNQTQEKNDSSAASEQFNTAKDNLHTSIVKIRKAIRYFYKSDAALMNKLQLNVSLPTNYAQWRTMVDLTLSELGTQAQVVEKLALLGFTADKIAALQDDVSSLDQLKLTAEKEDGEAQLATAKKNELFDQLMSYCSDLRECLNLFYEGTESQELEKVGIVVKS
jgi:hypothetical protein